MINPIMDIAATSDTPMVQFSPEGMLTIQGRSLPENAFEFYDPVLSAMRAFMQHEAAGIQLNIQLDYFNSSSGRYLFEMFHLLEGSKSPALHAVNWYVDKDDELMMERGAEMQSLVQVKFKIYIR
ncbi:MAG: DUF1987 domain-containing protein [Flavobacteriales bacterium]